MTGLGLALALASVTDWTPARWNSAGPKSLDLVRKQLVSRLSIERRRHCRNWLSPAQRLKASSPPMIARVVLLPDSP